MAVRRAGERGVRIVMTNAYHESVTNLYLGFAEIMPMSRHSVLAGRKEYRGGTQESLITIGLDSSEILDHARGDGGPLQGANSDGPFREKRTSVPRRA